MAAELDIQILRGVGEDTPSPLVPGSGSAQEDTGGHCALAEPPCARQDLPGVLPATWRPCKALSGAEVPPLGEQRFAPSGRGQGSPRVTRPLAELARSGGSSFQSKPPPPALLAAEHLPGEESRSGGRASPFHSAPAGEGAAPGPCPALSPAASSPARPRSCLGHSQGHPPSQAHPGPLHPSLLPLKQPCPPAILCPRAFLCPAPLAERPRHRPRLVPFVPSVTSGADIPQAVRRVWGLWRAGAGKGRCPAPGTAFIQTQTPGWAR